jgi:hypothetical protein
MQSLSLTIGIGGVIATIAVTVGALVLVQYLTRQHSRKTLQPYADLRGWREVPEGVKSLMAYGDSSWKRTLWGHAGVSVAGEWNGARAELAMTRVYKGRSATVVAVACSQTTPSGLPPLGPVSIMAKGDVSFQYYTEQLKRDDLGWLQTSALGQRFDFLGRATDVLALITPEIEHSLVSFAGQINNASYDGETASVTWLGFERDPARIDAALEVASALRVQAAVRRNNAYR